MEGTAKRGRGRGRGTRARGRGRGRGKKVAVVVSDEEASQLLDSAVGTGIGAAASNVALMEDADVLSTGGVSVCVAVGSSTGEDVVMQDANKENEMVSEIALNAVNAAEMQQNMATSASSTQVTGQSAAVLSVDEQPAVPPLVILPQTIDMEADISQLEAPTFTTISRGPPEPMLRLKWDHKVNLIGEKVLNPMIHCCDQCDKPILLYGRMIPCKHVFCLKCARTEPVKVCPRCNDKVVRVEQSGLGTVFMCTHGGSRYGNTGCRRTYLSQRDLQAHINHRHITQLQLASLTSMQQAATNTNDIKQDIINMDAMKSISVQRKLSESSAAAVATATTAIQAPSTLLLAQRSSQMRPTGIGNIPTPGSVNSTTSQSGVHVTHSSLTQANLARINTANAQDCHQGKVALHQTLKKTPITQSHHQTPETVADASYYSSVLNSFGSSAGSSAIGSSNTANAANSNANSQASNAAAAAQNQWQQNQYYR